MEKYNLNNKRFVTAENNSGLSSHETVFDYRQQGDLITGTYQGGLIQTGQIIGKQLGPSSIKLLYHCLTKDGALMAGESTGILSMNGDKVQINFDWQWLNGDQSGGKSEYIEIL